MSGECDTPEQKHARSVEGGTRLKRKFTLDEIWEQIKEQNRAAGPWGVQPVLLKRWRVDGSH